MHNPITIIFSYLFLIHTTAATFIGFVNSTSAPYAYQVCESDIYQKVCCIPLDLNVELRGWGWFRAVDVAFTNMGPFDIFSAVYPPVTGPPCSGQIISHQIGSRDWLANVAALGGAGSALAMKVDSLSQVHLKFPDYIILNDVRYEFSGMSVMGMFQYRNAEGATIFGREFGGITGLTVSNSTNSSILSNGATGNASDIPELSADQ